jgi:hypothetical protein
VTAALILLAAALAAALVALGASLIRDRARRAEPPRPAGPGRILFPFVAEALSPRALDAALRLARAEQATLVPVFLARVSLQLPLDAPLPRQSGLCMPLQEAIEQRASRFGVGVDARVVRGRSHRHALREAIASQRFDRIVIAAAHPRGPGFGADEVRWLLDTAPGEIIVLRPGTEEQIEATRRRPRTFARRRLKRTLTPVPARSR